MPSNAEIAKDTIEQFKKIQDYMVLAKEEHAVKTYDKLKIRGKVMAYACEELLQTKGRLPLDASSAETGQQ